MFGDMFGSLLFALACTAATGQTLNSTALDSSGSAVSTAPGKTTVGTSPNFWNLKPSVPTEYAVHVGNALSFKYNSAHNVYLMYACLDCLALAQR